jgi:hypothetical protein
VKDTLKGKKPHESHFVTFYEEGMPLGILEDNGNNKVGLICMVLYKWGKAYKRIILTLNRRKTVISHKL